MFTELQAVSVPAIPNLKLLRDLRKFDGSSEPEEFLERYMEDLQDHGVSSRFMLQNFDRVLEGVAKSWFSSVWPHVKVSAPFLAGDFDMAWLELQVQFMSRFCMRDKKADFQQRNRNLRFSLGDDVELYVTKKQELLKGMNPLMS